MDHIVLIGAGNVSVHLSRALKNAGHNIVQVYSRSNDSAATLASHLNTEYTDDLRKIRTDADLYIIALPDDALKSVIENTLFRNLFLVHTAGSVPMNLFSGVTDQYGVLYPLQTLSKNTDTDFSKVPLCIEGSNPECLAHLMKIGTQISGTVRAVTSDERRHLHLAAVFACNFTNYMYSVSKNLLDQNGLSFDLLHPLITETAHKACHGNPDELQTGPAIRNDQSVLETHSKMLEVSPAFRELYTFISASVTEYHKKK